MKKITTLVLLAFLLSSCVTSRGRFTKTADVSLNENYTAIANVEGRAFAPKLWILFIPIGGSSDQGLYNRAYKRALSEYENANGITSQMVEYKKVTVPLLLITFVNKHITVNGVAYEIKKDNVNQPTKTIPAQTIQPEPTNSQTKTTLDANIKSELLQTGDKVIYVNPKTSTASEAIIKHVLSKGRAIIAIDKLMFEVSTNNLRKI